MALVKKRSSLAIGNLVGSCISNILGAFSLGLIFLKSEDVPADTASLRIYAISLLALTTTACGLFAAERYLSKSAQVAIGAGLIVVFVIYIISIAYFISRGRLTAPELSDSDSDSDSESDGDSSEAHGQSESQRLLPSGFKQRRTNTAKHVMKLAIGFIGVTLSGYVISISATNIVDELGGSDLVFGIVVLSIATTLPEKFMAVISGKGGHAGILVANTVGSNIFLLSLCLGIVWTTYGGAYNQSRIGTVEIAVLLASTIAMAAVSLFGIGKHSRVVGIAMLIAYLAFLAYECFA